MDFEDEIIKLSDWLIEQSETYSEALIKLEKLTKNIAHEIILRAIEHLPNYRDTFHLSQTVEIEISLDHAILLAWFYPIRLLPVAV